MQCYDCLGLPKIKDDQLERVMEELEMRCWEKVQAIIKEEEGLGIEYDENVICDVCRSVSLYFKTKHLTVNPLICLYYY